MAPAARKLFDGVVWPVPEQGHPMAQQVTEYCPYVPGPNMRETQTPLVWMYGVEYASGEW